MNKSKYYDVIFSLSYSEIDEICDDIDNYKLVDDEYFRAYLNYSRQENKTLVSIKSKKDKYICIGYINGNIRNDFKDAIDTETSLSADLTKLSVLYETNN